MEALPNNISGELTDGDLNKHVLSPIWGKVFSCVK